MRRFSRRWNVSLGNTPTGGSAAVKSSSDLFWDVLTDYERLDQFIPNLASSELVLRQGDTVQLQQVGSQKLLGLRWHRFC